MDLLTDSEILSFLLETNLFESLYHHQYNLQLRILLNDERTIKIIERHFHLPITGQLYYLHYHFTEKYYSARAQDYFNIIQCYQIAARNGLLLEIQKLEADIQLTPQYLYDVILEFAAWGGHKDLIEYSIQKGAFNWDIGIGAAARGNHKDLVLYFYQKIGHLRPIILYSACMTKNTDMIKLLLSDVLQREFFPEEKIKNIFSDQARTNLFQDPNLRITTCFFYACLVGNLHAFNLLSSLYPENSNGDFFYNICQFPYAWKYNSEELGNYTQIVDIFFEHPSFDIKKIDFTSRVISNLITNENRYVLSRLMKFKSLPSMYLMEAVTLCCLDFFIWLCQFIEAEDWSPLFIRSLNRKYSDVTQYLLENKIKNPQELNEIKNPILMSSPKQFKELLEKYGIHLQISKMIYNPHVYRYDSYYLKYA